MLPVNPAWKEGSMMDLIETTPKMDLAIHDIEHLVEELRAYHAIYSPLFQRREQREAAHSYLQGLLAPLPRKSIEPMVDGSDFPKQGGHSVGVKRQYCGELGKRANCQAGVFVGYVSLQGYTVLDRRLYVPTEWLTDAAYAVRRQQCGLPPDLTFKTKPVLAQEM